MAEFTDEQLKSVEAAILDAHEYMDDDTNLHLSKLADEVMGILTKPKPVFQKNEVIYCEAEMKYFIMDSEADGTERHLNKTEVPALALALERLERLANEVWLKSSPGKTSSGEFLDRVVFAQTAIDDVKAML